MRKLYIRDKLDRAKYAVLTASFRDIKRELHCSRSTAYRILNKYACALMVDQPRGTCYRVISAWDLEEIKKWYFEERRGNPNFHDPLYQSELARRPRIRKKG